MSAVFLFDINSCKDVGLGRFWPDILSKSSSLSCWYRVQCNMKCRVVSSSSQVEHFPVSWRPIFLKCTFSLQCPLSKRKSVESLFWSGFRTDNLLMAPLVFCIPVQQLRIQSTIWNFSLQILLTNFFASASGSPMHEVVRWVRVRLLCQPVCFFISEDTLMSRNPQKHDFNTLMK